MRPIQSLKYILLLGILAVSLVAKPSFSESSDMEKDSGSKNASQVVGEIRQLLSKSLNKFKNGENENAAEIAFDAYLNYEKIEPNLITQNKTLGVKLESAFSQYRGEIKRGAPLEDVKKLQDEILLDLSKALELLKGKIGFWESLRVYFFACGATIMIVMFTLS